LFKSKIARKESIMIRPALNAMLVNALLLVLLAFSSTSNVTAASRRPATPPYKITAIKAMLYYEQKGTFSRDILAAPEMTLWNTIIGEGGAGSPSGSTMVVVEVTGKAEGDGPSPPRKVELTATASGKVLLKRAVDIGLLEETGKFYGAFWLYDTGCNRIKLSARVVGQTQPSAMTKFIPFQCGE
jgi:hypothetical protein